MAKEQKWMKVERLVHVDWNPRTPEELKWDHVEMVPLIASVKSVGVVQPIAVWADKAAIEHCDYAAAKHPIDGVVIAGNRRLEAAMAAGLKEIPALVFTDISSAQAQEITRLENEVRLGVDPLKDASLIGSMLGLGYSQKEIAAHFGVSEARICRRRKLLDLVPAIRELAEKSGKLTADALERIALYPKDIQERCAKEVVTRVERAGQLHVLGEQRVLHLAARIRDHARHAVVGRIRNLHHHGHDEALLHDQAVAPGCGDRLLHGGGVGAHEPSRPQQRAAEVARDHHAHVRKPRAAEHLESGHSRRTLRLPIVRAALAAVCEDPCGNVVARIVMQRTDLGEMGSGLLLALHMAEARDEAAPAVLELAEGLGTCRYGVVAASRHA